MCCSQPSSTTSTYAGATSLQSFQTALIGTWISANQNIGPAGVFFNSDGSFGNTDINLQTPSIALFSLSNLTGSTAMLVLQTPGQAGSPPTRQTCSVSLVSQSQISISCNAQASRYTRGQPIADRQAYCEPVGSTMCEDYAELNGGGCQGEIGSVRFSAAQGNSCASTSTIQMQACEQGFSIPQILSMSILCQ